MAQTVTEKIFSKACGKEVQAGEIINAKIDRLMTMELLGPIAFGLFEELKAQGIYDKERLVMIMDHLGVGHNPQQAELIRKFREYAKKYQVEHFYDIGFNGICHQLMVEEGYVLPGTIVVGTDAHSTTYGAMGAFGTGVSTSEAAVIMATGSVWFRVPETILITLKGKLPLGVYGKDVGLEIMRILKCDEVALYKAVEFTGDGVVALSIDDRLTICNMMAEVGAKNGFVPADGITEAYLKEIGVTVPYEKLSSDPGSTYFAQFEIDLDQLVPSVAVPHLTSDVHPITELEGTRIDHVFLGSCTSGRLAEIGLAARILKGKRIADDVRMIVVPASQKIYLQAVKAGYVEALVEAGVIFESSSCASCGGKHTGVLADGTVCISTTNRNFQGRMGSKKSSVYLASAAAVAAAALTGTITDPRKYLKQEDA